MTHTIAVERPRGLERAGAGPAAATGAEAPRGCEVVFDHEAATMHILIGKNRKRCFCCGATNTGWEREFVDGVTYAPCGDWE